MSLRPVVARLRVVPGNGGGLMSTGHLAGSHSGVDIDNSGASPATPKPYLER